MFKRWKFGKYIVSILVLFLVFSITGCGKNEDVVAKVGDIDITKDELYNLLVKKHGEESLDALITDKIIELEIEKANIEITEEEIEKEFGNMEDYYGGPEVLAEAMLTNNVAREVMDESIKLNLSMKKLVASDIVITDQEIEEFYVTNSQIFNKPEQVDASHILVDTEELANEVLAKLDAGDSFEDLVLEYSKDGSKDMGGNLGLFGRGQMVESFDKVAFSLPVGETSEPVKSDFGYYIIRVNEKLEATEGSLEGNKEEIEEMILESKIPDAFNAWYETKMNEYTIVNNLNK